MNRTSAPPTSSGLNTAEVPREGVINMIKRHVGTKLSRSQAWRQYAHIQETGGNAREAVAGLNEALWLLKEHRKAKPSFAATWYLAAALEALGDLHGRRGEHQYALQNYTEARGVLPVPNGSGAELRKMRLGLHDKIRAARREREAEMNAEYERRIREMARIAGRYGGNRAIKYMMDNHPGRKASWNRFRDPPSVEESARYLMKYTPSQVYVSMADGRVEWKCKWGLSLETVHLYWDSVAQNLGYEGLETYLMCNYGNRAGASVPEHMRRHHVEGAYWCFYDPGYVRYKRDFIALRRSQLERDPHAAPLAEEIARKEYFHPEWRGLIDADDFVGTEFNPGDGKKDLLLRTSLAARQDPFPELAIDPRIKKDATLMMLKFFLHNYRRADNLFRDGGADEDHSTDTADLVAQLLQVKGFASARRISTEVGVQRYDLTAVWIGDEWYLIDMHREHGQPLIIPVREAATHGIALDTPLPPRDEPLEFDRRIDLLNKSFESAQRIIREFMNILSSAY